MKIYHTLSFRDGKAGAIPFNHGIHLEVHPGETTHMVLGATGQTVNGRIKLQGLDQPVNWQNSVHSLEAEHNRPAMPERKQFRVETDYGAAFERWLNLEKAYWNSESGRAAQLRSREYTLVFDVEGRFTIHNVEPGTYRLNLHFTSPGDSIGYKNFDPVLARGEKVITIPSATQPIDLGIIEVDVK